MLFCLWLIEIIWSIWQFGTIQRRFSSLICLCWHCVYADCIPHCHNL